MARPSAADRIADLTAEVEQQRTRAEAAEAELRELRNPTATGQVERLRSFRCEMTIRLRHGQWERRYVVEGAAGAVEFWCRTSPAAVGYSDVYGGFEVHRPAPYEGDDGPPDHGRCSALSERACWHTGSSLYASDTLIPRWKMAPEDHESVFLGLVGDYRRTFDKEPASE